jgi:hypothetical protein
VSDEQDIKRGVESLYPFIAKATWVGPITDNHGHQLIAVYLDDFTGKTQFAPFMIGDDWCNDNIQAQFHRWNYEDGKEQLLSDILSTYPLLSLNYKAVCDCGASKTSNPNCHSHWCSVGGIK